MSTRHIANKMERQMVLERSRVVKANLLPTKKLSTNTLVKFLENYKTIFLKPIYGRKGRGIIRVKLEGNHYRLQFGTNEKRLFGRQRLIKATRGITGVMPYMIQRGVRLIKINGRPIDFRILMLKPYSKWVCMGVMGKWAAPRRIVTNYAAGGKAITLKEALMRSKGLSYDQCKQMEKKLISISFEVARAFSHRYKNVRKLGIDVAIDENLRIWILEPNTDPGYNLFKSHRRYNMIKSNSKRIARMN